MPTTVLGVKLYNLKEASVLLGISYSTMKNYHSNGRIAGQKIGRATYIAEDEIKRFLEGNKKAA